jgi:hypothetical protein
MPTIQFLVNLLEDGVWRSHVCVRYDSEREFQALLARRAALTDPDWTVDIVRGSWQGYDGKPLHEAHIWLSTPVQSVQRAASEAPLSSASTVQEHGADTRAPVLGSAAQRPTRREDTLSWQQSMAVQRHSKALLRQLGIHDLGKWK